MADKRATEMLAGDAGGLARAEAILSRGGLVAVPTETVYGLAARADDSDAVAGIYAAKGRPDFNPLIVHVAGQEQAERYAHVESRAARLLDTFWPGPLTLVLPRREDAQLAPAVSAALPTIALRAPAHPLMRALLERCDFPLAAPSANRSGFISPTTPEHVLSSLDGRIDAVIDGGACRQGLESTIVALRDNGWSLLRPGPIAMGDLVALLGEPVEARAGIEAPGQLASHYAPGKPVRLDARTAQDGEYLIGFGEVAGDCTLSSDGDLGEAAARLYDCLHSAARAPQPRIAVAPVPEKGVGVAINDRLRRAAA